MTKTHISPYKYKPKLLLKTYDAIDLKYYDNVCLSLFLLRSTYICDDPQHPEVVSIL